jgi:hypothetical protein
MLQGHIALNIASCKRFSNAVHGNEKWRFSREDEGHIALIFVPFTCNNFMHSEYLNE